MNDKIASLIKYPSGEEHPEVYVPMGKARFQQWWCHQMIDHLRQSELNVEAQFHADFYKRKLLKEMYRKEYYENQGWDFTFKIFRVTVVEIGPWVRTYHAWTGLYGEKITVQLPKVKA